MTLDIFKILSAEKKFRQDQIFRAWFDVAINNYEAITTLPAELKQKLKDKPWLSVQLRVFQESKLDNTKKALLELADGQLIEAVLMGRLRLGSAETLTAGGRKSLKNDSDVRYTICVSSQVGCAMKCGFCATGKAGFSRNLTAEEIVDQYRFWQKFLAEKDAGEIDNMVIMGQGEPLLNYDNVKTALNIILKYTNIGPSKITISTCGIPAMMDKLVEDKDFPPVRFALSLHGATDAARAKIMPSQKKGFLEYLTGWAKKYHKRFPSRAYFIGLEYAMLDGINDSPKDLKALIKLASQMGKVRINLIPYNSISAAELPTGIIGSDRKTIEHWHTELMKAGFVSTIRYSQGQDIAAACGQLSGLVKYKQ